MVGTNLKTETMALMDKRGAIEGEVNTIIQRLCQPGGPGLSGNLLDSEGFPRADIDIPSVRADRHRLAELKHDHKDLTEKMNQYIQLLHAAKVTTKPSSLAGSDIQAASTVNAVSSASSDHERSGDTVVSMDADVAVSIPFAVVDEITEASPAADDGLQLGDQILKFGSVIHGDDLLTRLASEVQAHCGCTIPVVVSRQGAILNLSVTPRTWKGRGLLGCHFRIL